MTSSTATKVLLAHIALWALTTARDYGKLGHFIVSAPIASLSVCLPQPPVLTLVFSSSLIPLIFHLFVISNPSFNLDFNYFPFTRLSAILSFLHLPHSPPHRHPLPSTLIALLLLQEDRLPDGYIVSTSFIERSVYNKRTEQKGKKRKLWRPLFLCQCTLSAGFSNTNSYCSEEIKDTLLNASHFGCCHLKDLTHSTHKSSRCYTVGDMW